MHPSFQVTYLLTLKPGEDPEERIRALQLEQSAELPGNVINSMKMEWVTGSVMHRQQLDPFHLIVTIAWPQHNHAGEITQLFNLLFGNVSLKHGILILDIQWKDLSPGLLRGPAFGITRLRRKWGIRSRALSCTALKPMGYETGEIADLAYRFALGGIDIIKDDHGITNHPASPFRQRVSTCVKAMDRAAQKTGYRARYFANITGDAATTLDRYRMAGELGADGVLLAPLLCGPAMMHHLAHIETGLPIMAHPSFSGTFACPSPFGESFFAGFRKNLKETGVFISSDRVSRLMFHENRQLHGFETGLFLGGIMRALGADFVIYPNSGGRFAYSDRVCRSINEHARSMDSPFFASFPTPGGGMKQETMRHWLKTYGQDTTFLMGGNLYEGSGSIEKTACKFRKLLQEIE